MDYREMSGFGGRKIKARRTWRGDGQRREKGERQMPNGVAELRVAGAVPGVNGVERFEFRNASIVEHADQVQAGIGDGAGPGSEPKQGQYRARRPDLGVVRAGRFQSGER